MVKMVGVVKEVKRMRLFGVSIAKAVSRLRLFGKDIYLEVEIPVQQPLSPPVLLSPAVSAPSPSLLLPAVVPAVPILPYNSMRNGHSSSHSNADHLQTKKIKIKFIEPKPPAANNIEPQLPQQVRTAIQSLGGTDLVFLANKKVEMSDVEKKLNRLFIPKDAVATLLKALTAEEKTMLKIRGDKIEKKKEKNGKDNKSARVQGEIGVMMVDGKGKRHVMDFKKWPSLGKLVFVNQWYKFAKESELEGGVDSIQLWCFRDAASRLCFAVVKNERTDRGDT